MYKLKMAHPFERQKALVVKTNENKKKVFQEENILGLFHWFPVLSKNSLDGRSF